MALLVCFEVMTGPTVVDDDNAQRMPMADSRAVMPRVLMGTISAMLAV